MDPTYRIAFSEDLTFHDLAGHYVPQGDHFQFRYGPVALAMKAGATPHAADDVRQALFPELYAKRRLNRQEGRNDCRACGTQRTRGRRRQVP